MKKAVVPLAILALALSGPSLGAMAAERERAVFAQAGRDQVPWSQDERRFTDAYARATWVHAHVLAERWDRATAELALVRKEIGELIQEKGLNSKVKQRLASLIPLADRLEKEIANRNTEARTSAGNLVAGFSATAVELANAGWWGPQGGGAGGMKPRGEEQRERR